MRYYFPFLFFAAAIFLLSCSEDPSSVGIDIIEDNITFGSATLYADTSATYRAPITGSGVVLLLGRFQASEAWTLLQFGPFSQTFPDSLIIGAQLRLVPEYWFKDSIGTLAFTIHKLKEKWSQDAVTYDALPLLFDESPTYGSYSKIVSPHDTVIVDLDTALVRAWFRSGVEIPEGILLKPTPASDVIYGFTSDFLTNVRPQLVISHFLPDTARLDSSVFRAVQDAFVATGPVQEESRELMILQSGIADRGYLKFDLSGIPRRASITSANLEIVRNMSLSIRNELTVDTVLVYSLLDETKKTLGGFSALARGATEDDSIFTADVRTIVQQWVIGQPNHGLALRAAGEITTFDRFAIYGAESPHRPRLTILYSVLGR